MILRNANQYTVTESRAVVTGEGWRFDRKGLIRGIKHRKENGQITLATLI